MKQKLILFFVIVCSFQVFGQDLNFFNKRPKKNLFLDFAGNGGLISINHEKIHLISFKLMRVYKIGFGYTQDYSLKDPQNYFISIPTNITLCFGKRRLLFELGLGATIFLNVNDSFYEFSYYPIVGYRFQPFKANKLFFKAAISLPQNLGSSNYSIYSSKILFIPVGLSIGKSF